MTKFAQGARTLPSTHEDHGDADHRPHDAFTHATSLASDRCMMPVFDEHDVAAAPGT